MAKLKKYRVKLIFCPTCKGNGFLKVGTEEGESIHQCWECDSEGEYYVHEPQTHSIYDDVGSFTNTDIKLH
tara:strand:- start:3431 stop:3643 length:213 start_codon:yes stop_codon:yes gene_type:complete